MTRTSVGLAFGAAIALALPAPAAAQEKPKSSQQPAGRIVDFSGQNLAWAKVFDFVADHTGLPLVHAGKLPTGTFTFMPPKTGGKARAYTVTELIDAINDGLMAQGFILVRRAES